MKSCRHCQNSFVVAPEDLEFYALVSPEFGGSKFQIPPPELCPQCRRQRRLAFRNERSLYYRTCDASGQRIFSMYPSDVPFPVYDTNVWRSDSWDAAAYGRSIEFNRPFFEQFADLASVVPHVARNVAPDWDENSDYTNCAAQSKNCYMISQAEFNQDCYHSRGINHSKDCCDCSRISYCELCYECVNCTKCYECRWCKNCHECSGCFFSTELRACKNCFGCHGLVRQEYCIYNRPVGREEWERFIAALVLSDAAVKRYTEESRMLELEQPKRANHIIHSEDCSGDNLLNCKSSHYVFDSQDLEACKYCFEVSCSAVRCHDLTFPGLGAELLYECSICFENSYHLLFCHQCNLGCSYLRYCDSVVSSKHCFGCYGLKRKENCILNKAYTRHEYERNAGLLVSHMRETSEWGEFFPVSVSSFSYNETVAQDYFPLTEIEVLENGWRWREALVERSSGGVAVSSGPISDQTEACCSEIYSCQQTGQSYRIVVPEFQLYRRLGVPLPVFAPIARHRNRVALQNPSNLWERNCSQCKASLLTSYAKSRPETVLCEDCYARSAY